VEAGLITLTGQSSKAWGNTNGPLGPVPIDGHNDCVAVCLCEYHGRFSVGEDAELAGAGYGLDKVYRVAHTDYDAPHNTWTIILEELHGLESDGGIKKESL
jgi:hypothetical protein